MSYKIIVRNRYGDEIELQDILVGEYNNLCKLNKHDKFKIPFYLDLIKETENYIYITKMLQDGMYNIELTFDYKEISAIPLGNKFSVMSSEFTLYFICPSNIDFELLLFFKQCLNLSNK